MFMHACKIFLHEIWKISADRKKLRSNRNSTVKIAHSAYLEVNTDRDLAAGECNAYELQIGRSRMLGWWIRLVTDRLVFRRLTFSISGTITRSNWSGWFSTYLRYLPLSTNVCEFSWFHDIKLVKEWADRGRC